MLSLLENPVTEPARLEQEPEAHIPAVEQKPLQPALRLVVDNTQNSIPDPAPDRTRRAA
jgi:hypothetical protein